MTGHQLFYALDVALVVSSVAVVVYDELLTRRRARASRRARAGPLSPG